jgi:hypothetical protein
VKVSAALEVDMEESNGRGLWVVLERAVRRRDAQAFRACIEVAAGGVGADLGLVSVDAKERRWLAMILGERSGMYGDASAEPVLQALEPLEDEVVVEDTRCSRSISRVPEARGRPRTRTVPWRVRASDGAERRGAPQ